MNTDLSSERAKRALVQRDLEEKIHNRELREMSLLNRWNYCRNVLFGKFENVKGDKPTEFRRVSTYKYVWGITETGILPKKLDFPAAEEIKWYSELLEITIREVVRDCDIESDKNKAERLASLVFGLGTIIHPYIDGNGQTMKSVALSYLDEYAPETYGDAHFPERQNKADTRTIRMKKVAGITKHNKRKPSIDEMVMSDPDMRTLLEVQTVPSPTIPNPDLPERELVEFEKRREEWAERTLARVGIAKDGGSSLDQLLEVLKTSEEAISQKGVSKAMMESTSQTALQTFFLYLTTTNRGKEWVKNYVETGNAMSTKGVFEVVRWVEPLSMKIFNEVNKELRRLLGKK